MWSIITLAANGGITEPLQGGPRGRPFSCPRNGKVSLMKLLSTIGLAALLLAAPHARSQTGTLLSQRQAPMQLRQINSSQMSSADRAVVTASWSAVQQKAQFFGYDLSASGWSYVQVQSPDTPDYVMLQFRRPHATSTGASAFTALVSRRGSKVWVVPVLYGGATPWKSASAMNYTREVFNRAVPPSLAKQAIQPAGNWAQLGLTFTSLAGDDAVVLSTPSNKLKWIKAPGAILIVTQGHPYRTVQLSDVHLQGAYRIWDLAFDAQGRILRVRTAIQPNTPVRLIQAQAPPGTMLKNSSVPQGKSVSMPNGSQ